MFVIGIFAFFMFIISLFVCTFVLSVQYLIIRRKIHQDKRAVNFRAKYATLSTFFIQWVVLSAFSSLPANRMIFSLAVFTDILLGFLWLFFVATNADEMWRLTGQKGYLLWPLAAASVWAACFIVFSYG